MYAMSAVTLELWSSIFAYLPLDVLHNPLKVQIYIDICE